MATRSTEVHRDNSTPPAVPVPAEQARAGDKPETPPPQKWWFAERTQTACVVILTICVVGFALSYLKGILTPFFIALFLFYLVKPLTEALGRWGVPRRLLFPVLFIVIMAVLAVFGQIFYSSVAALEAKIPWYRERLIERANSFLVALGRAPPGDEKVINDATLSEFLNQPWNEYVQTLLGTLMGFAEVTLMVAFYLLFLFIEARKLPRRVREAFEPDTADDTRRIGRNIDRRMKYYLLYKTFINLGLGLSTGLICYLVGLDFWLLWGAGMFLLNYVTYVGSIVAIVPPVLLAFIQFENPWVGLLVALLLIGNRLLWIDYMEILVLGNLLNLSPVVLLLSIAFFGYIWGPVGLLLAVPLVTTAKIILSDFEETHHLAVLISEK